MTTSKSWVVLPMMVLVLGGLGYLAATLLSDSSADEPAEPLATEGEVSEQPEDRGQPSSSEGPLSPQVRLDPEVDEAETATVVDMARGDSGQVKGRVLGPEGQIVAGATVELMRGPVAGMSIPGVREPTGLEIVTDANGTFLFASVSVGEDYIVVASNEMHGTSEVGGIKVAKGEVFDVGELHLKKGIRVYGSVTANGRPVDGAVVTLRGNVVNLLSLARAAEKPIEISQLTRNGAYQFDSIPVPNFEILVDAEGYARAAKPGRNFLGGNEDQQLDFELVPAQRIGGTVIDDKGRLLEGALVKATLVNSELSYRCEDETRTDATGRFMVEQVAEGNYHMYVELVGYSPATRQSVAAGISDLEIRMEPQGEISGIVFDEATRQPIAEFDVTVLRMFKGRTPGRTQINGHFRDAQGRFTLKGLDPNTYLLEARAGGYAPSQSLEFSVVRGDTTRGIEVAMNRGGSVSGRVVDSRGQGVANALVSVNENKFKRNPATEILERLSRETRLQRRVRTKEDGSFMIDLIVPGTYQVSASHADFAAGEVNDIAISKNSENPMDSITLLYGAMLSGSALDQGGLTLAGATLQAVSGTQDFYQATTDHSGSFQMKGLLPGEYSVSITNYPGPESPLIKMLQARDSAQKITLRDGERADLVLRLQKIQPREPAASPGVPVRAVPVIEEPDETDSSDEEVTNDPDSDDGD